MPKETFIEANVLSSTQQQANTSSPRFIQKTKRVDNKKKRLAEALRENLRKRKEQMRGRKAV